MELHFLGTGGSYPTSERGVSAVALRYGKTQILLDCGEGTQRQFMKSPLSFMKTTHVFISHFHGDHFLGLPGLLQTMSLNGRVEPLHIYGPDGMRDILDSLVRLGVFTPSFDIVGKDLKPGERISAGELEVTTCQAEHSIPALAFRLDTGERRGRFDKEKAVRLGVPEGPLFRKLQEGKDVVVNGKTVLSSEVMGPARKGLAVVYSGDTVPCAEVERLAGGATALIHEATALEELRESMDRWGHSTAKGAAELAKRAGVRELFLVHLSSRYKNAAGHISEAGDIFPGVHVPSDLESFTLKHR